MMGIVDNIIKGMKKDDAPIGKDYEIDYEDIYTKGEKLYGDWTSDAPVFDENYPGISMFDEGGDWNKDYREASGKELSSGTGNPRDRYFRSEQNKLLIMPEGNWTNTIESQRELQDLSQMISGYGDKPRYATKDVAALGVKGGEIASPFKFAKHWKKHDTPRSARQDIYQDFPTEKPF